MIIDCHGHYTTTPPQIEAYRNKQRALLAKDQNHKFSKGHVTISDDEIRDSIVNNQLKVQKIGALMSPFFRLGPVGWGRTSAMKYISRRGL